MRKYVIIAFVFLIQIFGCYEVDPDFKVYEWVEASELDGRTIIAKKETRSGAGVELTTTSKNKVDSEPRLIEWPALHTIIRIDFRGYNFIFQIQEEKGVSYYTCVVNDASGQRVDNPDQDVLRTFASWLRGQNTKAFIAVNRLLSAIPSAYLPPSAPSTPRVVLETQRSSPGPVSTAMPAKVIPPMPGSDSPSMPSTTSGYAAPIPSLTRTYTSPAISGTASPASTYSPLTPR